jgi:PAS domain S-box-containing protein
MLTDLLAALNDCVWAFDVNTQTYLFISPSVHTILEYSPEDFQQIEGLGDEIIDQRDRKEILKTARQVNSDEWRESTYRVVTKSGKVKLINQKKRLLTDKSTGHDLILSVIKDVSDDKHAQDEIVWTKNNLEALINNTGNYIWSIDRDGRYIYMNSSYRKRIADTMGVVPKEGDDAYAHSGGTKQVRDEWRQFYERALSGERYITLHESPEPQTKQRIFFEVSFNPIYKNSKDEVVGVGCFAVDITERLKTEEALIEQNERLKNIASLSSHELRRPVASMLGLMNIMDRENFSNPENEQIIEHLFTVSKEIDEVIRLIVNKTFMDSPRPADK